jgi:hypothetical protein
LNFIYPLGDGSRWEDNELMVSVSLLRKHCKEPKIFVVGEKPTCNVDVEYIPNFVEGSRYQKSMSNILKGLEAVGEPFVLMNDDFFCTKDFDEIPLYWDMTVKERMKFASSVIYSRFLERSLGELNYAVHKPFMVEDIELFKDLAEKCIRSNSSVRIAYGNIYKKNSKQEKDIKLKKIGEVADWFSIGDAFLTPENKLWLTRGITEGF